MNLSLSKDKTVTRDERRGSRRQIESGARYWAHFVFQIKARATTSNKDISDRMRKLNVYSEGADRWGHTRHSKAFFFFRLSLFATDEEWLFLKQVPLQGSKKMASCALPHLIHPIWICQATPYNLNSIQHSDQQFVLSLQWNWNTYPQHASNSFPLLKDWNYTCLTVETFHVCTDLTGTQYE